MTVTAAQLIEKLQKLPPETVIGVGDDDGTVFHVSRTALATVHPWHPDGVAVIDPSFEVLEDS